MCGGNGLFLTANFGITGKPTAGEKGVDENFPCAGSKSFLNCLENYGTRVVFPLSFRHQSLLESSDFNSFSDYLVPIA